MFIDRMGSFKPDYKTMSSKASLCVTSFCTRTYYICTILADVERYLQIRGGSTSNRGCNVIASLVEYIQREGGEQTSQLIESPFSVTFTKTAIIII